MKLNERLKIIFIKFSFTTHHSALRNSSGTKFCENRKAKREFFFLINNKKKKLIDYWKIKKIKKTTEERERKRKKRSKKIFSFLLFCFFAIWMNAKLIKNKYSDIDLRITFVLLLHTYNALYLFFSSIISLFSNVS